MISRKIITSLLIATSIFIAACARLDTVQTDQNKRVWPAAPASARIAFEQAFSTPQELGIGKGFWQWLGDIVFGEEAAHMVRPMAVVTVDDKLIYVADPGVRGVHRFNAEKQTYQLIKSKDGGDLPSPVALAADRNGNVYVSDSKLAQVLMIPKGMDQAVPVLLDTALQQPTGLAIEPNSGDLYLVDTLQHQILIFNSAGKIKKRFGSRGIKPGEFNYPTLIWENNGTLLVTDALNFRIQSFDLDGNYLASFGEAGQSSGHQSRPKGVAMDKFDHIYVVDALLNNIQLFDRTGKYLMTIGEQGQQPGQFWLPAGIHITPQQKIYVADSHNRRVQVFRYVGEQQ
jgi:DNA-binding beta-propeller fold protein YncE